jgi:hypothetical protein
MKIFDLNIINGYFSSTILKERCNVILLNDVLEHLPDPNELFYELNNYMDEQTVLIIKTGNINSINSKIIPREWQYLKSLQHICFYNKRSLATLLMANNLKIVEFHKFRHAYGGLHLIQLIKNILKGLPIRLLFKANLFVDKNRNYAFGLANDHFIAVVKKTNN